MSNVLATSGAQPDKPTKFAPMYTGRFFTGIWTSRSPLRDAASSRNEEKYYGPRGDAMIAGANVEITNRLTMGRRAGNPIYDNVNTYSNVLAYDEFRINKGLSDVFGTTLEQIDVMTDQTDQLYASNGTARQSVFTKTSGAGQSHMKQVANQLYFGNGIDNKKWNQSLIVRNSGNNSTAINTDSYPFFDTFLIDNNNNIQQMIGVKISTISAAAITSNVLSLTVASLGANQAVGTQFMLWGFTNAATKFLNGATIALNAAYTSGGTTLTAVFTHADMSQADTGYVQIEAGGSPVTGVSVPTWGTTVPAAANNFNGSITIDGTVIWINRGSPTQNWGLKAPTDPLVVSATGASTGWAQHTYYSPAGIYVDNVNANLWQITTAGLTGGTQPVWPGSPTPSTKIDVTNVAITSNVVTFITETQGLAAGNVVVMNFFNAATFLNGVSLTVLSGGLTTTGFTANFTHPNYTSAADFGVAVKGGTTQADGTAVWTCIQSTASLTWAANHHYREGDFIRVTIGAGLQMFMLRKNTQPCLNSAIAMYGFNSTTKGAFNKNFPAPAADFTTPVPSSLHWKNITVPGNTQFYAVNGAGIVGAATDSGKYENWEAAITCNIWIPAAGTYNFTLQHDDGGFFAFDSTTGAYKVIGSFTAASAPNPITDPPTTAKMNYSSCVGNNNSGAHTESATWSFPAAGNYGLEIDWTNWEHASTMIFTCNTAEIAITPDVSGASQPAWPTFTAIGASWDAPNAQIIYGAKVQESAKQYTWNNIGPNGDFTWIANTNYTLPGTQIVDTNSNQEGAYETGATGTVAPVWNTATNAITADPNPNLTWLNEGPVASQADAVGKITATSAQGWLYGIALVNTIDNTVSNIGPISAGTGPVIGGHITFAAGAGLPSDKTLIDSQADYVAIFRSTDGLTTELLIPSNGNTFYTVPLTQYLAYGYVDTTPDTGLDTLVQAAAAGENTPPLPGAQCLTFHLNRLWYAIGNTVFWTTGPLAPVGNGVNGVAPRNFDKQSSLVKRLVPTAIGVLVFTVSDISIIPNSGGTILPSLPYCPGVGISNYNALDTNGPSIGFYTTDKQFLIFSPSAGLSVESNPLADQFRKNDGLAGTSWNPATARVAFFANGEDVAWFVADGVNGWFKLINTPAPDQGACWSPFATIQGGVAAIKSVETSPGVHTLLLGPTGSGKTRQRSIDATTDGGTTGANGTAYPAYAVFGSYVLVAPGQVALVSFFTTDSVNVGSPLILGVLLDEALPYYTGSFEMLKVWVTDPPGLPPSKSILGQRFYMSEDTDAAAACRHIQVMIQWPAEAAANELQSFTIFGAFRQEA